MSEAVAYMKKNHKHDTCKFNNFIYTDLFINV